jgi:hypothetical protein
VRKPQRGIRRIVLWATLSLILLSCVVCSGVAFYTTTIVDAPLIVSAGDIHMLVMRGSELSPDSIYKVLKAPIEVGFSWRACNVAFFKMNDKGLKIGDYMIQSYSCGK